MRQIFTTVSLIPLARLGYYSCRDEINMKPEIKLTSPLYDRANDK